MKNIFDDKLFPNYCIKVQMNTSIFVLIHLLFNNQLFIYISVGV